MHACFVCHSRAAVALGQQYYATISLLPTSSHRSHDDLRRRWSVQRLACPFGSSLGRVKGRSSQSLKGLEMFGDKKEGENEAELSLWVWASVRGP